MTPSDLDALVQGHTPVTMVPLHSAFEPMTRFGHRFLLAGDGLWIEARKPWCHVLWPVAACPDVVIPAGRLAAGIELAFGRLPMWAVERFVEDAREVTPNEVGAVVIWNAVDGSLRYERCASLVAGVGHLRAHWPALGADEHVVMDLHSHGPIPAYFSGTDRSDTGADLMVCGVVGRLDKQTPEVVVSLFAVGREIPITVELEAMEGVCDGTV